jgi:hypothetical protein
MTDRLHQCILVSSHMYITQIRSPMLGFAKHPLWLADIMGATQYLPSGLPLARPCNLRLVRGETFATAYPPRAANFLALHAVVMRAPRCPWPERTSKTVPKL